MEETNLLDDNISNYSSAAEEMDQGSSEESIESCEVEIKRQIDRMKPSVLFFKTDNSSGKFLCGANILSETLDQVYLALEVNAKLRADLLFIERKLILFKVELFKKNRFLEVPKKATKRRSSRGFLSQFMAPYFKDENGFGCELPSSFKLPSFSPYSELFLGSEYRGVDYAAVANALKDYIITEIAETYNLEALKKEVESTRNKEQLEAALKAFKLAKFKVNSANKKTLAILIKSNMDRDFDWLKVSSSKSIYGLSPEDCQNVWNVVLKPSLKFKNWNGESLKRLKELAIENRFQNWDYIAKEIHTGLSGFLAFAKFRKSLSHLLTNNGAWTELDDSHLLRVVKESTIGNEISWGKVMYYIDDKNLNQCINRWYRVKPALKKGRFSSEEDALLLHSVDKFGLDFVKISSVFGNRNLVQLRDRYSAIRTALDDDKKSGEWSLEEDEELLRLVRKYGESKWKLIARELPARNRVQIRQRYSAVLKKKLMKDPNLDLKSLDRIKRSVGSAISQETFKSVIADENISSYIKCRVADGEVHMPPPLRPGRKAKCTNIS